MKTGICSITLRQQSVDEVIACAAGAGLQAIEWGGDVHVPPGDPEHARGVAQRTTDAGLEVCSYGSYYRCGADDNSFPDVLQAALALGAPLIRIWAGDIGSDKAGASERERIAGRIRQAVGMAAEADAAIGLEYHRDTLTDTLESALRLVDEVDDPRLKLYWQPRNEGSVDRNCEELRSVLPHLCYVHVFHWGPGGFKDRYPLSDGGAVWREYFEIIRRAGLDPQTLLEFVRADDPAQVAPDVQTLRALVDER